MCVQLQCLGFNWCVIVLLQCTIDMPASVQDVFRPPVECGMCRDVVEIERVHTITPQQFEER